MRYLLLMAFALSAFPFTLQADEAQELAKKAVAAAGGADKLPKIIYWQETYVIGDKPDAKGTNRTAIVVPPDTWYQGNKNIALGNNDRTEKAYMVGVWTLRPLLDKDTKLTLLPDAKLNDKTIKGIKVSKEKQPDISLYFDEKTFQLARMDWRTYKIDFSDWKETDGFKYPSKAYVRKPDGKLYLRTEFSILKSLPELPKEVQPKK